MYKQSLYNVKRLSELEQLVQIVSTGGCTVHDWVMMLNETRGLVAVMNNCNVFTLQEPVQWLFTKFMSGKRIWVSIKQPIYSENLTQIWATGYIHVCFMHEGTDTHILTKTLKRECPHTWIHTSNYTARVVSELTCHPFNMLSLNGSLYFWLDDIMALHTLNYRHTLLLLQPSEGKRERLGHSEKESGRQREGGRQWGQKCPYLVIHACVLIPHFFLCPAVCFVSYYAIVA